MSLIKAVLEATANGEKLAAQLGTSKKYKYWQSIDDEKDVLIANLITAKYGRGVR